MEERLLLQHMNNDELDNCIKKVDYLSGVYTSKEGNRVNILWEDKITMVMDFYLPHTGNLDSDMFVGTVRAMFPKMI